MTDKLILLTESCKPTEQIPGLIETLTSIGLVAEPFKFEGHIHHRAGDEFLNLITFIGCSPYVVLDPGAGEDFCHVRIYSSDKTVAMNNPGITRPRCPGCKYKITDGETILTNGQNNASYQWTCPGCETTMPPRTINWRHAAGFGNLFIEIWGIQPELAVPSEALQDQLKETCPTGWNYLFISE